MSQLLYLPSGALCDNGPMNATSSSAKPGESTASERPSKPQTTQKPKSEKKPVAGAKTLARGLDALKAVVDSENGLSAQQVAEILDVHRTVAHRMLVTLVSAGFLTKGGDAKYRGSVGLMNFVPAVCTSLKDGAEPLLAVLAEDLGATVTLLVAEGDRAIALVSRSPKESMFQMRFAEGDTHPLELAAGGKALRSIMPEHASDASLDQIRADGYAITQGEVEPGAWGLAVPLRGPNGMPLCVNVITHREAVVRESIEAVKRVAGVLEAEIARRDGSARDTD